MRKIFTEKLPHNWRGVDWEKSVGYIVDFVYDDIESNFQILEYIDGSNNQNKIIIQYKNKIASINLNNIGRMNFSKILGYKKQRTLQFKYNIGDRFKDNKRDIEILNRKIVKGYNRTRPNENCKIYNCKCYNCGDNTIEITENHLNEKRGCPTCHSKKLTVGINDIATTDSWMIKYFVNKSDTKKYTANSNTIVDMHCPFCQRNKKYMINKLYSNKKLPCQCNDSISYPEKFLMCFLEQLKIDFIYQLSSKNFSWCKNYKYDFYIPSINTIIETNGEQHYKSTSGYFGNIEQIILNDKNKEKFAKNNGIEKYIKIDCSKSNTSYIQQSIINSDLFSILQKTENDINWELCNIYATKNIIKEVCNYKNNHPYISGAKMAIYFHLNPSTISRYLNKGMQLGWCVYGGRSRCIEIFKNNKSLGVYKSANELSQKSLNDFEVLLNAECIKRSCRNEISQYKGFVFKYVS